MGIGIGDEAPDFLLEGTDNNPHSLADFAGRKAVCIIFFAHSCPYAHAYLDRIRALEVLYPVVGFACINSNDEHASPDDAFDRMAEYADSYELTVPYLRDAAQDVAKAYGARTVPEAFLFGPDRTLRYRGRIDDNWHGHQVADHTLRDAIEAVLAGTDADEQIVPASASCDIIWS